MNYSLSFPPRPLPSFLLSASSVFPSQHPPRPSPHRLLHPGFLFRFCCLRLCLPIPCLLSPWSVKICASLYASYQFMHRFSKHSQSTGCIPENVPCATLLSSMPFCLARRCLGSGQPMRALDVSRSPSGVPPTPLKQSGGTLFRSEYHLPFQLKWLWWNSWPCGIP